MGRALMRMVVSGLALVVAGACSPTEVPEPEEATGDPEATAEEVDELGEAEEGTVRFLIAENFWADWTPYQSTAQSQRRLEQHVYDYLLDFPTGDLDDPQPMLATDWEQIDETTWEFELRDDVTFHDGEPLTGEDVAASIEFASGVTGEESVLADRWVPTEVEVVDDVTVRFETSEPFAAIFAGLKETHIISAEDLEGGLDEMAANPNGTGPFTVVADEGERKEMEANEDYWRDPPQIDSLVWEFVADPQTRVSALLAGQAQVVDRVPPQQIAAIDEADGYATNSVTGIEQVNLWSVPGRLEIWDESPEFREAVTIAIDRAAIVDNLILGESEVATSFMPSEALMHSPQEPAYEQDLDRARELLAEAGVEEGEVEFEIWIASGFLPRAEEVGETIAENLRAIGLDPQIVTTDVAGMVDDAHGEGGSGTLYHLSWSNVGDPHLALQIYSSANPWADDVPEIDRMLAEGLSITDPDAREQLYDELQAFMWEELPHVPLYNSDFTIGYDQDLEGLQVLPNYDTYFYPASLTE